MQSGVVDLPARPMLARSPDLADWLLERALGEQLPALPPGAPEALHTHLTRR